MSVKKLKTFNCKFMDIPAGQVGITLDVAGRPSDRIEKPYGGSIQTPAVYDDQTGECVSPAQIREYGNAIYDGSDIDEDNSFRIFIIQYEKADVTGYIHNQYGEIEGVFSGDKIKNALGEVIRVPWGDTMGDPAPAEGLPPIPPFIMMKPGVTVETKLGGSLTVDETNWWELKYDAPNPGALEYMVGTTDEFNFFVAPVRKNESGDWVINLNEEDKGGSKSNVSNARIVLGIPYSGASITKDQSGSVGERTCGDATFATVEVPDLAGISEIKLNWGDGNTYTWSDSGDSTLSDFNDGEHTISNTFVSTNVYNLRLDVVHDGFSYIGVDYAQAPVNPQDMIAAFGFKTPGGYDAEGVTYSINAENQTATSDCTGPISSYRWDYLRGGSQSWTTGVSVSEDLTDYGVDSTCEWGGRTDQFRIRVTNQYGAEFTSSIEGIEIPQNCLPSLTLTSDTVTCGSATTLTLDLNGGNTYLVRYKIDYGDGTVSDWLTDLTTTHTYAQPKTYTAKLIGIEVASGTYGEEDAGVQGAVTFPTVQAIEPVAAITDGEYIYNGACSHTQTFSDITPQGNCYAGIISRQWFVGGEPVMGATGSEFTYNYEENDSANPTTKRVELVITYAGGQSADFINYEHKYSTDAGINLGISLVEICVQDNGKGNIRTYADVSVNYNSGSHVFNGASFDIKTNGHAAGSAGHITEYNGWSGQFTVDSGGVITVTTSGSPSRSGSGALFNIKYYLSGNKLPTGDFGLSNVKITNNESNICATEDSESVSAKLCEWVKVCCPSLGLTLQNMKDPEINIDECLKIVCNTVSDKHMTQWRDMMYPIFSNNESFYRTEGSNAACLTTCLEIFDKHILGGPLSQTGSPWNIYTGNFQSDVEFQIFKFWEAVFVTLDLDAEWKSKCNCDPEKDPEKCGNSINYFWRIPDNNGELVPIEPFRSPQAWAAFFVHKLIVESNCVQSIDEARKILTECLMALDCKVFEGN